MGYAVGQGSGTFLAKEVMKSTYFKLYFRWEPYNIFQHATNFLTNVCIFKENQQF